MVGVQAPVGQVGSFNFSAVDGKARWSFQNTSEAVSSGNAGSDLYLFRYDDAGASLGPIIAINRSMGNTDFYGDVRLLAGAGNRALYLDAVSGYTAAIYYRSGNAGGTMRWAVYKDLLPEDGGNAGSNYAISRWADDGSWLGVAMQLNRDSGNAFFSGNVIYLNPTVGNAGIAVRANGANASISFSCTGGAAPFEITQAADGAVFLAQSTTNPVLFYVGGAEILRIASDSAYLAGGTLEVGYRKVPAISAPATLTRTESGKCATLTGALVVNATQNYQAGDTFSLNNGQAATRTITFTGVTCYIAGSAAVKATVTLALSGLATLWFKTPTECYISGNVS